MSSSPLTAKRFVISLLIGWLVLIVAQAFLLYSLRFSASTAIIDSVISNTLLLFGAIIILNTIKYYLPTSYQYVGVIGSCLVLSVLWIFMVNSVLKVTLGNSDTYLSFLQNSLVVRYGFAFLVLTIVSIGAILWYNWLSQAKSESRKAHMEKLSKESELFKLRQQLQPHFLFNSLNSINALIGQNPQQARKMVQQLSDFLRGTLKKEESQLVSIEEEVNYLNLYLEIEKVRFGNRLQTAISIEEACKQKLMPTLLLQPVVENAIKFGLYDTTGETLITLSCKMEGKDLLVSVSNPHDPETSLPIRGTGFGLSSIKRRLYLLYARNDLLFTENKDNIFTTTIKIPQ